jgi:hypothetical protein
MRIKFLKPHLDHNIGDYAYVDDGIGNYLIQMKVATDQEPDNAKINKDLDKHLASIPKKKKDPK